MTPLTKLKNTEEAMKQAYIIILVFLSSGQVNEDVFIPFCVSQIEVLASSSNCELFLLDSVQLALQNIS